MHHGSQPLESPLPPDLGATGQFPEGKLDESDEGEIKFAIGARDGKIVLEFGKPVTWVGMSPAQALAFGKLLRKRARALLK